MKLSNHWQEEPPSLYQLSNGQTNTSQTFSCDNKNKLCSSTMYNLAFTSRARARKFKVMLSSSCSIRLLLYLIHMQAFTNEMV